MELYNKDHSEKIAIVNACIDNIILGLPSVPTIEGQCVIEKENLNLPVIIINIMDEVKIWDSYVQKEKMKENTREKKRKKLLEI